MPANESKIEFFPRDEEEGEHILFGGQTSPYHVIGSFFPFPRLLISVSVLRPRVVLSYSRSSGRHERHLRLTLLLISCSCGRRETRFPLTSDSPSRFRLQTFCSKARVLQAVFFLYLSLFLPFA